MLLTIFKKNNFNDNLTVHVDNTLVSIIIVNIIFYYNLSIKVP